MQVNNYGSIFYQNDGKLTTALNFKVNKISTIGTSSSDDVRIYVLDKENNDAPLCVIFKADIDNGLVRFSTNNVKNCKINNAPFIGHKYLLPGDVLTILGKQFIYENPDLPNEIIEMTQNTNKELNRKATLESNNSNNRRHTILPMKSALKNYTPNNLRTSKRLSEKSSCNSENLFSNSEQSIDRNSRDDFGDPPDLIAFNTPPSSKIGAITRRRSTLGMNTHSCSTVNTLLIKTPNSLNKPKKMDCKNSTPEIIKQTLRTRAKSTDINMHFLKRSPATIRLSRNSISSIPSSTKEMKLNNCITSNTPQNVKTIRDANNSLFKRRSSLRKSILKKTPLLQDKVSTQNSTRKKQYKPSVNEDNSPSSKNVSFVNTRRSTKKVSCTTGDIEENDVDSLSNEDIYADNSEKNSSDNDSDQNDDSLSKTTLSRKFSTSNAPNTLQLPNQPSRKNSKKLNIFRNSSMSSLPDRENLGSNLGLRNSFVKTRSQRSKSMNYLESVQSGLKSPSVKHLTRSSTIEKSGCQKDTKSRTLKRTRSESPNTFAQAIKRPKLRSVRNSTNRSHEISDEIRELLDTSTRSSQYEFSDIDGIKQLLDSSSDSNCQMPRNVTKGPFKNTKQRSPKNDLTDVRGVKNMMKTPRQIKSPINDLRDIKGIKKLMATPKKQKSPNNDLSNVIGVKKLLATPKVQNSPKNDLRNIVGIKTMFKSPKIPKSPENDLRNVTGIRKIFETPQTQKSPENDLSNIKSFKKIFATPKNKKSPKNDLSNITGVKQMFKTPKHQKSPRNDLRNVVGIRKMLSTPKSEKSPKNDLTNIIGVKKLMKTPKVRKTPEADYTNVDGVKKLFAQSKLQKPPRNSLNDLRGVKQLLCPTKSPLNDLSDVIGVKDIFNFLENSNEVNYEQVKEMLQNSQNNKSENDHNPSYIFTKKKSLRTYTRKNESQNDKHVESDTETEPEVSETVNQWVEDQDQHSSQQISVPITELTTETTSIRKSKRTKRPKNLEIIDTISTKSTRPTRNTKKKNAHTEKNKYDGNKENVKGNGSTVELFEQQTEDITKNEKPRKLTARVLIAEQNVIQDNTVEIFEKNPEDNGKLRNRDANILTTKQNVIQDEPVETLGENTESSVHNGKLRRRGVSLLTPKRSVPILDEPAETVENNTEDNVTNAKPQRRGARVLTPEQNVFRQGETAKSVENNTKNNVTNNKTRRKCVRFLSPEQNAAQDELVEKSTENSINNGKLRKRGAKTLIVEQNIIQVDRTSDVQENKSKDSRNKRALIKEPIDENEVSVRRSKRQVAKHKDLDKKKFTEIENDMKDSTPITQHGRGAKLFKNAEKTDVEEIKNNNSDKSPTVRNNKELGSLKNTNTKLTPTFDNSDLLKTHKPDLEDANPPTKKLRGRQIKNNQLDTNKIQKVMVQITRSKILETHITTDIVEKESENPEDTPTPKTRRKKIHPSNEIENQTKKGKAKLNIESKVNIDEEPPIRQSKRIKNQQKSH